MKHELARTQWMNHVRHNTQFMRGTPRTMREAFGANWEPQGSHDGLVFVVVMVCFAVGMMVAL